MQHGDLLFEGHVADDVIYLLLVTGEARTVRLRHSGGCQKAGKHYHKFCYALVFHCFYLLLLDVDISAVQEKYMVAEQLNI